MLSAIGRRPLVVEVVSQLHSTHRPKDDGLPFSTHDSDYLMSVTPSPAAPLQTDARPGFPSDATRSERRRRQRGRTRDLATRAGDPRQMSLNCAQSLVQIAEAEADPALRRQLFRIARAYRMRHDGDEHRRRMCVLG